MLDFQVFTGDARTVDIGIPINSIVCSPPYAEQRDGLYPGVPETDYPDWCVAWLANIGRWLVEDGSVLINIREHIRDGVMSDYVHRTRLAIRAAGWLELDELIWIKPNAPPVGDTHRPRRSWERILWFSRTARPYCDSQANGKQSASVGMSRTGRNIDQWVNGRSKSLKPGMSRCRDYILATTGNATSTHPAAYPAELAAWMIRLVTPPGGITCDPFCGGGTSGRAAILSGRRFVGVDLLAQWAEATRAALDGLAPDTDWIGPKQQLSFL